LQKEVRRTLNPEEVRAITFFLAVFATSLLLPFLVLPTLIASLRKAGITGPDMHKPGKPQVAEMGGLAIVGGFVGGTLGAIALNTFFGASFSIDQVQLFASLATIMIIALIGVLDDLLHISQPMKALIPLFAAVPLVAVEAGSPFVVLPLLGRVYLGVIYALVLVPLGITGASNAINILAGFNGIEVGMGAVAVTALAVVAYSNGATTSLVILLSALGALIATLYYNWYPARLFVGDIGTLSIGAVIASASIIGNFQRAGLLLMAPYGLDLLFKLINGFPKSFGVYKNGKLYCPQPKPVGLCQLVMKWSRGISEQNLVLFFIGIETILGLMAIGLYAPQLLSSLSH
jgi:UDP-N-acetylglucosamine--dolichyl-phosphate N-acetylglucosaminephosphotransferase